MPGGTTGGATESTLLAVLGELQALRALVSQLVAAIPNESRPLPVQQAHLTPDKDVIRVVTEPVPTP